MMCRSTSRVRPSSSATADKVSGSDERAVVLHARQRLVGDRLAGVDVQIGWNAGSRLPVSSALRSWKP